METQQQKPTRPYYHEPHKPNALLDYIRGEFNLPNDAAVAKVLKVSTPAISKVRNGHRPLGATLILRIHEHLGIPVPDIREISGEKEEA